MSKSFNSLSEEIQIFCEKRSWEHSSPNSLIASTLIELGELAEHYQWQKEFKEFSEEEKKEIGYEFVDVFFYLIRIANKSGIDIEKAFEEKMPKLEIKFPVGSDSKAQHDNYRKTGKNKLYE